MDVVPPTHTAAHPLPADSGWSHYRSPQGIRYSVWCSECKASFLPTWEWLAGQRLTPRERERLSDYIELMSRQDSPGSRSGAEEQEGRS